VVKLEEINDVPKFSNQLENKILYSNHSQDISISYQSTYTLKYVAEGSKQYWFNNRHAEVSKNEYLVLNNHTLTTKAKKGTKGLSIFLSPKLIKEIHDFHITDSTVLEFLEVSQKGSSDKIGLMLGKLIRLFEKTPLALKGQMDSLFIQLSEMIVEEQLDINSKFSALQIVKHNTRRELLYRISMCKEYLNDNIRNHVSLEKLSRNVGISKYYLHRLFKELNGITPLNYLTAIRLEKAKNELRYSRLSVLEIAIESGFEDASYFSKIFRSHTGISPSKYRNSI